MNVFTMVRRAPQGVLCAELAPLLTGGRAGAVVADLLAELLVYAQLDDRQAGRFGSAGRLGRAFPPRSAGPLDWHYPLNNPKPSPVTDPATEEDPAEKPPSRLGDGPDVQERTAWPLLSAPATVAEGAEFDVEVGLRVDRDPEVGGTGALRLPDRDVVLELVLVYDPAGVEPVGWSNPVALAATGTNPHPRTLLRMRALGGPGLQDRREIGVSFHVGGTLRGYASRTVVIGGDGGAVLVEPVTSGRVDLGHLLSGDSPDLVVVVERGADVRGQTLVWTARSPLPGLRVDAGPYRCGIGDDPAGLARRTRLRMSAAVDARDAVTTLVGLGRDIGDKVPVPIADAVRAVIAHRAPRPPSVLLVSAEPHVPWELAVLDAPEPGHSPFLGARTALGRWVLDTRRPPPRPAARARADTHAVISARYEGVPGWSRLPSAEVEAARVAASYPPCEHVPPLHTVVLNFLEQGPRVDVLHFALHGQCDPDNAQDGLVLLAQSPLAPDRMVPRFLNPEQVSGLSLRGSPFVFLNACQVGSGGELLGDYSGLARAFLAAGACAVVAPLWNIDDIAAGEVAHTFYTAVYTGKAVAEVLRALRSAVHPRTRDGAPATTLAYQFFGHPNLVLRRTKPIIGL
ncbi:hypothetical protein BJP25_21105 [Actinokineospora bangkokensis]|uniref:CHAT domain-containing protein n=2 Tax=Actinokineospora bangkokensis TaxID=1193682 RepID=A0A1Q9LKP9_9PSEU|nr:hypothetical protein BJP25_21105 [Actinokineospora bangkokensis]